MSRLQRQQAILRVVSDHSVRSQRDLIAHLEAEGHNATQATVSRDVRQLGLVKLPLPEGGSQYGLPGKSEATLPSDDELRQACQQFVTSVGPASAMVVIKTQSGHANAAAIAFDRAQLPEVVGTLAGDDTVLVLLDSEESQKALLQRLRRLTN